MSALAGSRAVVMGLGAFGGGLGAARYLLRCGADVLVTDLRSEEELGGAGGEVRAAGARTRFGEHREEDFLAADLVVVNPAVPPSSPFLAAARRGGARLTSAIELLLAEAEGRVLCVTGTQGKSSTSHVLAALLRGAGRRVRLGGNIGGSLLDHVGPGAAEPSTADDLLVLELSSYQLEALPAPPPGRSRVAAIGVTNVLADHLERHGSLAAYGAAKRRILDLVSDAGWAILPAELAERGWRPERGRLVRRGDGEELRIEDGVFLLGREELGSVEDVHLPGRFQLQNVLTALGMARALGVQAEPLRAALPEVRGLPHRLEELPPVHGRTVLDNGVSTTPDSTISALESLEPGCVLLCGGRRKQLPYDELFRVAAARGARVACFGEAAEELASGFARAGATAEVRPALEDATRLALELTPAGGTLLFSPACTSFDGFANFAARAQAFRAALPDAPAAKRP